MNFPLLPMPERFIIILLLSTLILGGCCQTQAIPREVTEELDVCTTPIRCPQKTNPDGTVVVDCGFISPEDKAAGYGCETERKVVTYTVYDFICL